MRVGHLSRSAPPSSPRTAIMKHYITLTDDQRTAMEQLTLPGLSNGDTARQLGVNKQSVAHVAAGVRSQEHAGRRSRPGRPSVVGRTSVWRLGRLLPGERFASAAELTANVQPGYEQFCLGYYNPSCRPCLGICLIQAVDQAVCRTGETSQAAEVS